MKKSIVILGPTASGKTDLAINIARTFNLNVVNCDSCQFLKHMPNLSASPSQEIKEIVPHYLFNTLEFNASLGWWVDKIKDIENKLIVGGTVFYPFNLQRGIPIYPSVSYEYNDMTWQDLYDLNQEAALSIHPNNITRINRHYSFIKEYNMTFQDYSNKYQENLFFIVINPSLDTLIQRIKLRTPQLVNLSLSSNEFVNFDYLNKVIGYKEIADYLQNLITYEEMIEKINFITIQYAKSQKKFLKKIKPDIYLEKADDYLLKYDTNILDFLKII